MKLIIFLNLEVLENIWAGWQWLSNSCILLLKNQKIKTWSSSNKKFAILNISDGLARFELPIWPELYEKSGHLLKENQLLYAVLQVDKSYGDETKLNCRWVDDLTKADEAMIEECDKAYNRAKQMTIRFGNRNNKPTAKVEKKEEKKWLEPNLK